MPVSSGGVQRDISEIEGDCVRGNVNVEPSRPPGQKPPVRITHKEEKRLAELRDWLRELVELERSE